MALADVLDLLCCPVCGGSLGWSTPGRTVECPRGHAYDVARQGHLNLLGRAGPRHADTAAMVDARERFLTAGHYAPLADRVAALAASVAPPDARVLEVGAGTGHYLARVLEALPAGRGVALDVSVAAARSHPRAGAVVADVWVGLPVADGVVDLVLDVFAPRNAAEFARVLGPSGRLLTVTPEPDHLAGVRSALGLLDVQPGKGEALAARLGSAFVEEHRERLAFTVSLDDAALRDLVGMGPNAFHRSEPEVAARVAGLDLPVRVEVAVSLGVWATRGR